MTTRKELFDIFNKITNRAFEVMRGKNSDYASDEDSLANFRSSEVLNVDPRKALLIRMLDKIKRQVNYIERGKLSVDSAEDDIVDLINYSVLLHALNREKEFEEAYEATKDKVPSFNDEDWGVSLLKENLTWLDEHHYPATPEEATEVPEFCDTPHACYYDGCSCERTNKFVEEEYVINNIIETENGYEVLAEDKGCKFRDDQVVGVYGDDTKITKIRLDDGRVYKTKQIYEVDRIVEIRDCFVIYKDDYRGWVCFDDEVKDVKTNEELTITQLETTDGTIYRT